MATITISGSNSGRDIANTTAIVESNPQCEASSASASASFLSTNGSPQLNRYHLQIDSACKRILAARQEMDKHYNQTFERERKRHAKEIIDIRDKHSMCEQAFKKKLESNEADHQRLLNDLNGIKIAHAQELRKLKDKIDDLKAQHDQDLAKKDAIIKEVKEKKHNLQHNFDLRIYELKTVRDELKDKMNEFQEVERRNLEELEGLNKKITEMVRANFDLQSQLEAVNEKKQNLQQEIESIHLESKRLEKLEHEKTQTISKLTNELETSQRTSGQICTKLEEEKRQIEMIRQQELENHRQSVESFTLKQTKLEQQYKAKIEKLEMSLQSASEETNKIRINLEKKSKETEAYRNEMEKKYNQLVQDKETVLAELNRLEELNQKLSLNLNSTTVELEDYKRTLQMERSEKQEKMAELKHALEEIESSHEEIEKLKSTNLELQTMIDKNSDERTEMLSQIDEQREMLIEVENNRHQINTKLSRSIMHIGQLEVNIEEKDKQLNEMEAKQKNMEKALEQSSQIMTQMRNFCQPLFKQSISQNGPKYRVSNNNNSSSSSNVVHSSHRQQQANQHLQEEFDELQRKNTKLKSEYNSMRKHSARGSASNTMPDNNHPQQSTSSASKSFSKFDDQSSQMLELTKLLSESTVPPILSDSYQIFDCVEKFESDSMEMAKRGEDLRQRFKMFDNQIGKGNNITTTSIESGSKSDNTSDYQSHAGRLFDLNFNPLQTIDSLEMEADSSTAGGGSSSSERLLKAQLRAKTTLETTAVNNRNKITTTVNGNEQRADLKSNVSTNTIASIEDRLNRMTSDHRNFPGFDGNT